MNTSSRATPFPQHQKHVSSITVTLTLNKNVFYTQPLLTPMTWAHTTLASDLQPINLHCSIFMTHLREPQQLGKKVTLLLPQENAFLFSKSTKKVSSTAATSL